MSLLHEYGPVLEDKGFGHMLRLPTFSRRNLITHLTAIPSKQWASQTFHQSYLSAGACRRASYLRLIDEAAIPADIWTAEDGEGTISCGAPSNRPSAGVII